MTADSCCRGRRRGLRRRRRTIDARNHRHVHHTLFLVLMIYYVFALATLSPAVNSSTVSSTPTSISPPAPINDVKDGDNDDDHHESIIFEGTFECESQQVVTLPRQFTKQELMDFFRDHGNRDVLLKGGGNQVDPISLTKNIFNEWTKRTKLEHATPPHGHHHHDQQDDADSSKQATRKSSVGRLLHHTDRGGSFGLMKPKKMNSGRNNSDAEDDDDEEVLAIHSDAPICPGLTIDAVSYTGCKLTVNPKTSWPQYEFTLLHDTYKAKGQKPIVWVFDRITGATSNSSGGGGGEKNSRKSKKQDKTVKAPAQTSTMDPVLQGAALIGNIDAAVGDHGGSRKTFALSRVTLHPEEGQQQDAKNSNSPSFRGGSFWGGRGGTTNSGNSNSIVGEQGQNFGRRCRVTYYGHVKVECSLPRSFLGFLPVSKHKMEERVSKSIISQLQKEGVQSVEQFAERLNKWSQMKDGSN